MTPQEFIAAYKDFAVAVMKKTKIPASIILAQAMHESAVGKKAGGFNFFGIKGTGPAGFQLWTTHEVIKGRRIKTKAKFRKYHSAIEAFEDYANMIATGKLKNAMNHTASAFEFISALQAGPFKYATDPTYVDRIMHYVRLYNLETLDKEGAC